MHPSPSFLHLVLIFSLILIFIFVAGDTGMLTRDDKLQWAHRWGSKLNLNVSERTLYDFPLATTHCAHKSWCWINPVENGQLIHWSPSDEEVIERLVSMTCHRHPRSLLHVSLGKWWHELVVLRDGKVVKYQCGRDGRMSRWRVHGHCGRSSSLKGWWKLPNVSVDWNSKPGEAESIGLTGTVKFCTLYTVSLHRQATIGPGGLRKAPSWGEYLCTRVTLIIATSTAWSSRWIKF